MEAVWRLDDPPCNWAFRPTRLPPNFRYKRARYLIGLGHRLYGSEMGAAASLSMARKLAACFSQRVAMEVFEPMPVPPGVPPLRG